MKQNNQTVSQHLEEHGGRLSVRVTGNKEEVYCMLDDIIIETKWICPTCGNRFEIEKEALSH